MAVFAPIPRASVRIATAVKPGVFSRRRKAILRSFMAVQCCMRSAFGNHRAGARNDETRMAKDERMTKNQRRTREILPSELVLRSSFWFLVSSFGALRRPGALARRLFHRDATGAGAQNEQLAAAVDRAAHPVAVLLALDRH